jgi:hypothetical protein
MGVQLALKTPQNNEDVQSLIRLLAESDQGTEVSPFHDPWSR